MDSHIICNRCQQKLPATPEYFNRNKAMKNGLVKICKGCRREYNQKRKKKNQEYMKNWREDNKEHVRKYAEERRKQYPDKLKIQFKKYYDSNKDKFSEKAKRYREENKEKLSEYNSSYSKKYRKLHKKELSEKSKKYYRMNKNRFAEWRHRRYSRENQVIHTLTPEQWEETLEYFDYKDAYTGLEMVVISQDHIIPVSKGGGYTKQNIIPCESNVNKSKGNRDLEEWYRKQDFFSEERLDKINKFMGKKENILQITMF